MKNLESREAYESRLKKIERCDVDATAVLVSVRADEDWPVAVAGRGEEEEEVTKTTTLFTQQKRRRVSAPKRMAVSKKNNYNQFHLLRALCF